MRSSNFGTAVLVLASLVVGGCSSSTSSTSPPTTAGTIPVVAEKVAEVTPTIDHPFPVYPYDPVEEIPSADLTGTLVVEGDCLFLIEPNFDERFVLLLPLGETSWDADTGILTVFDVPLAVDTEVSLGGVGAGRSDLLQPIADNCLPAKSWVVAGVL